MVVYSFSNTVYGVGDFFLVEKKVFSVRKRSQEIINVTKYRAKPLLYSLSVAGQLLSSFCTSQIREESTQNETPVCWCVAGRRKLPVNPQFEPVRNRLWITAAQQFVLL